jgi:ABC-type bacteriocin/lantibiotic exporter with double-glycine peptidase domain
MVAGLIETKLFTSSIKRTQKAYGKASNVANETIVGVRTAYSFVAEEFMYNKFVRLLRDVYKLGVKRAHITGLGGVRFTLQKCHIILLIKLLI